ncbi:MAG: polysaccharide deacetylase family protein [Acidobacteriota bacterium]
MTADEYRKDLQQAGKGGGSHAFSYRVPARLRDGKAHFITVRISDTDFDLEFTPREFQSAPVMTIDNLSPHQNETIYDDQFFDKITDSALTSARIIVPLLLNYIDPKSVIDIGCGRGAWLKAFQENGITIVRGLDGDYVDQSKLLVNQANFTATDLSEPFDVDGQYDLVVCLEVAEHLPASSAKQLIATLTKAVQLVLFSAAIPYQGGDGHLNEQWPEYWESLFEEYGFRRLDPIRRYIWQDKRVAPWYQQNLYLFVSDVAIANSEILTTEQQRARNQPVECVCKDILNHLVRLSSRIAASERRVEALMAKLTGKERIIGARDEEIEWLSAQVAERQKTIVAQEQKIAHLSSQKAEKIEALPSLESVSDANSDAPKYEGYHDIADCEIIHGWAWDSNHPDLTLKVDIYDGERLLATATADEYRKDLQQAGKGSGEHAFSYRVPARLKDGEAHSIRVTVAATDFDLGFTPKEIKCVSETATERRISNVEQSLDPARAGHLAARALILMYHSVGEVKSDPWSLYVAPGHFAEQLEVLRKNYHPIGLRQLTQALLDGGIPDNAVVITFDDGYANNLYNARPLLERFDVPATVFMTTGNIGREREFWDHELERLLLQPGTLPEVLRLRVNGNAYEWKLGRAAHYSEDDYQTNLKWRGWETYNPTRRHTLFRSLYDLLLPLSSGDRQKAVDDLVSWAGVERAGRATHHPLSLDELITLGDCELVEIGSHSVTHPVFYHLSPPLQRGEIHQSKAHLEEILGRAVTSFAYPYGCYVEETVAIVREAGYTCACSTVVNPVESGADPFQLPRIEVHDWNGEEFAEQLSRWLQVRSISARRESPQ